MPFPSPGDLPDAGIEPRSPTFQADSLPSEPPEKCTISVMPLSCPETIPPPTPSVWKNCLPQNRCLEPKRLGTAVLRGDVIEFSLESSLSSFWWVAASY